MASDQPVVGSGVPLSGNATWRSAPRGGYEAADVLSIPRRERAAGPDRTVWASRVFRGGAPTRPRTAAGLLGPRLPAGKRAALPGAGLLPPPPTPRHR